MSEHTCLTNDIIGWDKSKITPLIDVTTSAFVWKPGTSTPPTLLSLNMMMTAYYLTPIYTSSEKRAVSEHIKGLLVVAIGEPLMKALDRSVETLGL